LAYFRVVRVCQRQLGFLVFIPSTYQPAACNTIRHSFKNSFSLLQSPIRRRLLVLPVSFSWTLIAPDFYLYSFYANAQVL